MKKLFIAAAAAIMSMASASAAGLGELGIFNHVGADLSISTTGIGIEASTPITKFVQMRAGISFMPGISFKTDIDGTVVLSDPTLGSINEDIDMNIKGGLGRTQGDIIFNVYPFGSRNSFFIAAGAYFGGKSLVKLTGHSDKVAQYQQAGILKTGWVEVGDYKVNFEENGNIQGALVVNSFRPYLGIGYGRPCPNKRIGFMFEAGVQFMGKMKVCQGKNLDPIDISNLNNDDDWQKWIDKLKVYPVIKLTLTGRIF